MARKISTISFAAGIALIASSASCASISERSNSVSIDGAPQIWRPLTLEVTGPRLSETTETNPFTDINLTVDFSHDGRVFSIPGYFAACGQAALNGCEEGAVWRVKFTPDDIGTWCYSVQFRQGTDIVFGGLGEPAGEADKTKDCFIVIPGLENSSDPRDRGRLIYDHSRYLKFVETNRTFFKVGADAPENMLAFEGFDATPNRKNLRKSWAPHAKDVIPSKIADYDWNGRGHNLFGAISYLADQGINAVSFLTFNIAGDDQNVFPHRLRVKLAEYESFEDERDQWHLGVHHDRFDVSKLDQWQRVLQYANDRGLFLHFKLQETENDDLINAGDTGRERTLYVREIVARFGHLLALNWNIGEENNRSARQQREMAALVSQYDAYNHPIVLHTYPSQKHRYLELLGERSELTGVSLQGQSQQMEDLRPEIIEWTLRSQAAGRPWVVTYDEPGSPSGGVGVDQNYPRADLPSKAAITDLRDLTRAEILWSALTAGAQGVEYYYGYATGCSDLNCQDHRTRASKWRDARHAIGFFDKHIANHADRMTPLDNALDSYGAGYLFGEPGKRYVAYIKNVDACAGRDFQCIISTGTNGNSYKVDWFNPRQGGDLIPAGIIKASDDRFAAGRLDIGLPPSDSNLDWVVLAVCTDCES